MNEQSQDRTALPVVTCEEQNSLQDDYPAIETAYPLALASLETLLKRIEAQENRLQALMALVATLMLAVPTLAANKGLSFKSGWFYLAIILFVISIVIGITARFRGTVWLIDPNTLFQEYLHLPTCDFKKDTIYWAGKQFSHNNALVLARHRLTMWMLIFWLAELVALVVWVSAHP